MERRRVTLLTILEMVKKYKNSDVPISKIRGEAAMRWGLKFETLRTYLEDLDAAGFIELDWPWTIKVVGVGEKEREREKEK
jgi:hypothetical protein